MLTAFQNCLCESCSAFSCALGGVRVLLSDALSKEDESMEGARLAAAPWYVSWYCEQKPARAAAVVGKGVYLCLTPGALSALGCALPHSGRAAPGASSSIVTWLYPSWRQAALIFFSCVLSLGSCSVSCHGWGRFGNLPCTCCVCGAAPDQPWSFVRHVGGWAGTDCHSSWWSPN